MRCPSEGLDQLEPGPLICSRLGARTPPSFSRERISTKGRQNVDVRDVKYSTARISPTSTVLAEQPNGSGVEI
jgi:hypothetical protein